MWRVLYFFYVPISAWLAINAKNQVLGLQYLPLLRTRPNLGPRSIVTRQILPRSVSTKNRDFEHILYVVAPVITPYRRSNPNCSVYSTTIIPTNTKNFVQVTQKNTPMRGVCIAKFCKIFSLGVPLPTPAPTGVKFGRFINAIFQPHRCNVSPQRDEKPSP